MAETLLSYRCIALADQIQTAIDDPGITIEEQREILVDDLWNALEFSHGSRVQKLYQKVGVSIYRPSYVRSRLTRD